jgi:hypothetical protein
MSIVHENNCLESKQLSSYPISHNAFKINFFEKNANFVLDHKTG